MNDTDIADLLDRCADDVSHDGGWIQGDLGCLVANVTGSYAATVPDVIGMGLLATGLSWAAAA